MRRACHAGVEGAHDLDDFQGLIGDGNMRVHHGELVRAVAGLVVTRAGVPRRRDDALVVVHLVVLDRDPVCEAAARCLVEADALGFLRPGVRVPMFVVDNFGVARLEICDELVEEELVDFCIELAVEGACRRAADHRREPSLGGEVAGVDGDYGAG